jgi:hypothetical protein
VAAIALKRTFKMMQPYKYRIFKQLKEAANK